MYRAIEGERLFNFGVVIHRDAGKHVKIQMFATLRNRVQNYIFSAKIQILICNFRVGHPSVRVATRYLEAK